MDGLGTEGAAASLAWHVVNEIRKFFKSRDEVRPKDLDRLEKAVEKLSDTCTDMRVEVAEIGVGMRKLNGG